MRLRWSDAAVTDLENISDYLFIRTPFHTLRIIQSIYKAPTKLLANPLIGRPGRRAGTRELVLNPLPYLIVYAISGEVVHVVCILHGSQRWP